MGSGLVEGSGGDLIGLDFGNLSSRPQVSIRACSSPVNPT